MRGRRGERRVHGAGVGIGGPKPTSGAERGARGGQASSPDKGRMKREMRELGMWLGGRGRARERRDFGPGVRDGTQSGLLRAGEGARATGATHASPAALGNQCVLGTQGGARAGRNPWVDGRAGASGVREWRAPSSIVVAPSSVSAGPPATCAMMNAGHREESFLFLGTYCLGGQRGYNHVTLWSGLQVARFLVVVVVARAFRTCRCCCVQTSLFWG